MSVLSELAQAAEKATEEYAVALDAVAVAEAGYLRAYYTAVAESDPSLSEAARDRFAQATSVEEKIGLIYAQQAEKRCKAKVTSILARLSAAQSYHRMIERQT